MFDAKEIAITLEMIALRLSSPAEHDRNLEEANVVDGLFYIGRAIERLAWAVEGRPSVHPGNPLPQGPGQDPPKPV